jgi:hypothetical protein
MVKRPKSDGRCIHCRDVLIEKTKDHVFPSSWYPETTPDEVQRWTVPSCADCNETLGDMEKELFVRLVICINPKNPAAAGLSEVAVRSFGVRAIGIDDKERKHREALKDKVFKEAKPISRDDYEHLVPGLGPHPEASSATQVQIDIPADQLQQVMKKIVRGCEYWLGNGRIIEPPFEMDILLVRAEDLPSAVKQLLATFESTHLGPGLKIRRGAAQDGSRAVLYELIIWDTIPVYSFILPPEPAHEIRPPGDGSTP